ncbi:MAG: iron chelate uptake ABC transporter family permease subunit [candidate division NC10 bacterium]|nr:iron chelate uptake ABC transporter family permease subunit [candidate division NC10 bacterium]
MVGSVPVAPREAMRALLTGGADDPVVAVVRQIRLPRALLAGMVGAALALAGLGFQAISRNPLADPAVLGVSSGASFGVVIAMLLGLAGPFGNPAVGTLFAFAGALLAAVSVYAIAQVDGRLPITTLLLSGVIIGLFFVAASLITGAAISAAGSIGFVGLIVPHAVRLLLGPDNRKLVPAAALLGAAFLILADLLARIVMAPAELPVGVITSFCGAPLFVYLLRSRRGGESI